MTVLISDDQVIEHVSMLDCIAAVETAYAASATGGFEVSERKTISVTSGARLHSLSAASDEMHRLVANVYSGAPAGPDKRKSPVNRRQKLYLLFDAATGECEAIIAGARLAWLATGAMGAVAIDHMAPQNVGALAIVGSGRQARSALVGALAVRDVEQVRVCSQNPSNAETMVAEFAGVGNIEAIGSVEKAVIGADVVITTTTSATPVLRNEWLSDGWHINSIGAHYPQRREIDSATVSDATVIVDTMVGARAEKGELIMAEDEGLFSFDDVRAELGALVAGQSTWKRGERENTLFASSGSAIESLGAAVGALAAIPATERREFDLS